MTKKRLQSIKQDIVAFALIFWIGITLGNWFFTNVIIKVPRFR